MAHSKKVQKTQKLLVGVDVGSPTKFVLMDREERLLYQFYASNEGAPLRVA